MDCVCVLCVSVGQAISAHYSGFGEPNPCLFHSLAFFSRYVYSTFTD